MAKNDINAQTAKELADDAKKYGFGAIDEGENKHFSLDDDDDETEDKGDLDADEDEEETDDDADDSDEDTDEEDDEDSDDDDSEDDDDSDEDEDDSDDEEDEDDSHRKKKVIPFKKYNQTRKALRDANKEIARLADEKAEIEAKLPDDYQERVDALIKETGVQDPETLKKILAFTKGIVTSSEKKNETRLAALEQLVHQNKPIVDEFTTEWPSFEKDSFRKTFPNASDEQVKTAKKLMDKLAHDKKTGGKLYKDEKSGKMLLDPYELGYIFYKNRSEFEAIVTGKKKKGMESSRSQGITVEQEGDKKALKNLNKNSTPKDIRALDKQYSQMENGVKDLRTPEDNSI